MCYTVFFSTTSDEDLSEAGHGLFTPYRTDGHTWEEEAIELLAHPNRWYLECRYGGCSCHFRHIESYIATFGLPGDPLPGGQDEDEDDIESTAAFYDLIKRLVDEGHDIDVIDVWSDTPNERVQTMDVSLSEVTRDTFRFFASHRFMLRP